MYTCSRCHKRFGSRAGLYSHIKYHHRRRRRKTPGNSKPSKTVYITRTAKVTNLRKTVRKLKKEVRRLRRDLASLRKELHLDSSSDSSSDELSSDMEESLISDIEQLILKEKSDEENTTNEKNIPNNIP